MLNAIIVDDEEFARSSLYFLLQENCENVHVAGIAKSVNEALVVRLLAAIHRGNREPGAVFRTTPQSAIRNRKRRCCRRSPYGNPRIPEDEVLVDVGCMIAHAPKRIGIEPRTLGAAQRNRAVAA